MAAHVAATTEYVGSLALNRSYGEMNYTQFPGFVKRIWNGP